ncbi:MAG TPA: family 1 glycosylhydrolase [Ilumatobacteraceae bacterium]
MTVEMIGAFESTYQPAHDIDVAESTRHIEHRETDLLLLRTCGVSRVRYPIRWHRVEPQRGVFDWKATDELFEHMLDYGWSPIVDLVHHTSYPAWLRGGFADPRFSDAYLGYVEAVMQRYPWIEEYTLFNEPFATLLLCGHEGIWPPYGRGMESFTKLLGNVLPAISKAGRLAREILPNARHLHVDSCERHTGSGRSGMRYAEYANDRRFFVLDALLGRIDDDGAKRPFVRDLIAHGGSALLEMPATPVDQVGLDYYAHCQWHFGPAAGTAPSPCPPPLSELIAEYADRYQLPVWLGETNLRGYPSDRATWLKYTLEQCERAVAAGIDLRGFCWFPFIDSCDWDSLLQRSEGNVDPVGVFSIGNDGLRHPSTMSVSYARAAHGVPSAELPAFRFEEPVASWLTGWMSHVPDWEWKPAPRAEIRGTVPGDPVYEPLAVRLAG